ncbi:HD domain-containing protein [Runella sp.]|uniref:HD domain-containing protein n=1 Tax=Runella sp. TaxID=1960881 RepID=UPI003D13B207
MNKRKIFNDPVYGFITIPSDLVFDLIEHPYFQRLRRIRQLGLAELVYPGALHTRFHHALGAMHLMCQALNTLRAKGHLIWDAEWEAAQIAILLHDVGHGPFSHVLEKTIFANTPHEYLSLQIMKELNRQLNGRLDLAIQMFEGSYPRHFFHQLISSQLDMDRMDYLNRDCFFTGVAEGAIGTDRIIKMLDVVDDQLVVEFKGILSIENFLNARRLMYWQVYLHKTSICGEVMLIQAIRRARELVMSGEAVFAPPHFLLFLTNTVTLSQFEADSAYFHAFTQIDDYDIWSCVKSWAGHFDTVLSSICQRLLDRKLYKIQFSDEPFNQNQLSQIHQQLVAQGVPEELQSYFLVQGQSTNAAYVSSKERILIKMKDSSVRDIADASDLPTIKALSNIVRKYYVCWMKPLTLQS